MKACESHGNMLLFLRGCILKSLSNPDYEGPANFYIPHLIIKYIRDYPPYVKTINSSHLCKD